MAGIVTGCAVLAGAWLNSRISTRVAKSDREEKARGELLAVLSAFGAAIDQLDVQIGQLPPPPGRAARPMMLVAERLKTTDWLMGRISMAIFGRGATKAVSELISVSNRLMLLAPPSLMPSIQAMNGLIERAELRDEQWRTEWRSARKNLAAKSRQIFHPESISQG